MINLAKGITLKQTNHSQGYKTVALHRKNFFVHRLVAQTFIPNPHNKPQVNHIDGNRTNNHVSNLEWVTQSENEHHKVYTLGTGYTRKVVQHTTGVEFPSVSKCSRELGIPLTTLQRWCSQNKGFSYI